jgi:spore coat polysaccharide biosynthesis protein SpsF (cytidylyltransferase family)
MPATLCFVDACFSPPRARVLACRKLAGKPVLEWIVRAATDAQRIDGVIVVTNSDPANAWVDEVVPSDIPVFRGPSAKPLECLLAASDRFAADAVVRLSGCCPFVDPTIIDQLVAKAERAPEEVDYLCFCSRDGRPTMLQSIGLFGEWYRVASLRRLVRRLGTGFTGQPTEFVLQHRRVLRIHQLHAPLDVDHTHLVQLLESEDLWENVEELVEACGFSVDLVPQLLQMVSRCLSGQGEQCGPHWRARSQI